jgi:hypothetical protein
VPKIRRPTNTHGLAQSAAESTRGKAWSGTNCKARNPDRRAPEWRTFAKEPMPLVSAGASARLLRLCQAFGVGVGDFEIRVNVLDIVVLFQGLDQVHHFLDLVA